MNGETSTSPDPGVETRDVHQQRYVHPDDVTLGHAAERIALPIHRKLCHTSFTSETAQVQLGFPCCINHLQ